MTNLEKLDAAMAEIKATIEKHDVTAVIVLHKPNVHNSFVKLDSSYSVASMDEKGRVKLAADPVRFPTLESAATGIKDTSNMLMHLSKTTHEIAHVLKDVSTFLDSKFNAKHEGFKPV